MCIEVIIIIESCFELLFTDCRFDLFILITNDALSNACVMYRHFRK